MKKFNFFILVMVALSLTGCVSNQKLDMAENENEKFKLEFIQDVAYSQVDESFVRKMVPDEDKIKGLNGEYLVFQFKLTDKAGSPIGGVPLVWRIVGDNNTQIQKTDADGLVEFWEPVGALSNSLAARKSKWGPMQKDMIVKATVNPVGINNCKAVVKVQLYK